MAEKIISDKEMSCPWLREKNQPYRNTMRTYCTRPRKIVVPGTYT